MFGFKREPKQKYHNLFMSMNGSNSTKVVLDGPKTRTSMDIPLNKDEIMEVLRDSPENIKSFQENRSISTLFRFTDRSDIRIYLSLDEIEPILTEMAV